MMNNSREIDKELLDDITKLINMRAIKNVNKRFFIKTPPYEKKNINLLLPANINYIKFYFA